MEFKVHQKEGPNVHSRYSKSDVDIAYAFSKEIWKEFDRFCKAIVLFGSTIKKTQQPESDIDILIIIDDVSVVLSPELIETYRIITEKTIAKISKKLHVTTIKFTSFWDYIRIGDPLGINILREGIALIDTGFFSPLQMLLYQGRIRPTDEAIMAYYSRVPQTMHNSKWHIMQGTLDLYWAAIDGAHAALMKIGEMPPSPKNVADMLEQKLVKDKHISKNAAHIMRELYIISKKILHREIKDISGKEFDRLHKNAKILIKELKHFIDKKR